MTYRWFAAFAMLSIVPAAQAAPAPSALPAGQIDLSNDAPSHQTRIIRGNDFANELMPRRPGKPVVAAEKLDVPVLDLTLTNLEGCYRELRNDFNVAIERRGDKKFVTRWGTWSRGGMAVEGRDALYFIREPWSQCQLR